MAGGDGADGAGQVFFPGSVSEAIVRARLEGKQVVVYVAANNDESKRMEVETWPAAASALREMLILRLQESSSDAANFSAFCKINRAPTVAAIGPNGEIAFWHEGFISSADLVKGIEEAALKAQLARAMVAMLTHGAGNVVPPGAQGPAPTEERREIERGSSALGLPGEGRTISEQRPEAASSIRAPVPAQFEERHGEGAGPASGAQGSGVTDQQPQEAAGGQSGAVRILGQHKASGASGQGAKDADDTDGGLPDLLDESGNVIDDNQPTVSGPCEQQTGGPSMGPSGAADAKGRQGQDRKEQEPGGSAPDQARSGDTKGTAKKQKTDKGTNAEPVLPKPVNNAPSAPAKPQPAAEQNPVKSASTTPSSSFGQSKQTAAREGPKPASPHVSTSQTAVIQFRLTDGESMRAEFDKNAPLWDARAWLDANRSENGSPYDLAIPFPKRILMDTDLDKSFAELQLFPRASLLLIPKRFSNITTQPASSAGASNQPGVAAGVTRAVSGVLGYLNPLSYLWGPTQAPAEATAQPAERQPWEYGPNPQLERAVRQGAPGVVPGLDVPSQETAGQGRFASTASNQAGSSDQTRKRGTGAHGNIHGLGRSSDEEADPRRNNFWNGNSTQFGSNDNKDQ